MHIRINKYLSDSGIQHGASQALSRRDADTVISQGRVTINGEVATMGSQVAAGDEVAIDGERVGVARKLSKPVYIALNKPVGITCTTERSVAGNIVDFVDHSERIFPIGRLDKDSEGLILLTNDGDIVNKVLRVENAHEKEYIVVVDKNIDEEFVQKMSRGIRMSPEGWTKPCRVRKLGARMFSIILTQGFNRQIRRMSEACGVRVVALRRVRFLHILLGPLAVGRWRNLTDGEVQKLLSPPPPPVRVASTKSPQQSTDRRPQRPERATPPAQQIPRDGKPGKPASRGAASRSGPPQIAKKPGIAARRNSRRSQTP
jgi:23S rRNA pseudouridine2604 synthase